MESSDNGIKKMVVNEFESLEANHEHNRESATVYANTLVPNLENYYFEMLYKYANEVLQEKIYIN